MSVFGDYSQYYNLLYRDKDYGSEVNYILDLVRKNTPSAKKYLTLGCGTGAHEFILADKGFDVTGVDLSEAMLRAAQDRLAKSPHQDRLRFVCGNICELNLNQKFDAVLAMFHVINYQTTNQQLHKMFATVSEHLKPGGTFIFDSWYGPAVLVDPPTARLKQMENEKFIIRRIATPVLHHLKNKVDVNYTLLIQPKGRPDLEEITEKHEMRYLFNPEVEELAEKHHFEIKGLYSWLKHETPDPKSWSVCYVMKRV